MRATGVSIAGHIRISKNDEDSPARKKKQPHRSDDEIPSVQLTTFQSWQELGAWYAALEKDRRQPTDAIKAKAEELVQGKTDDMAKVKALYEYVSRNVRYVSLSFGLGRYQPHAASEVLSNGYGDCKDKNTLLAALLAAQGFQSTSVLIGSQHELDPDIPSPSQFDHVITRVPVDGKGDLARQHERRRSVPHAGCSRAQQRRPWRFLRRAKPESGSHACRSAVRSLRSHAGERLDQRHRNADGALLGSLRGDAELGLRFALRQIPNSNGRAFSR